MTIYGLFLVIACAVFLVAAYDISGRWLRAHKLDRETNGLFPSKDFDAEPRNRLMWFKLFSSLCFGAIFADWGLSPIFQLMLALLFFGLISLLAFARYYLMMQKAPIVPPRI